VALVFRIADLAIAGIRDDVRIHSAERRNEIREQFASAVEAWQQDELHRKFRFRVHSHHEASIMRAHILALGVLVPHEITTTRTLKFGRHDGSRPAEVVQRQSWRFDCDEVAQP
jgi:hypothetical protein